MSDAPGPAHFQHAAWLAQPQPIRRVPYTTCPLCDSGDVGTYVSAACTQHPLYQPALPPLQVWLACQACSHSFTEGYFDEAALAVIFSKSNPSQVMNPSLVEQARAMSAPIVERVSEVRGSQEGRWLDVGCGNGSLFTTAAEFGYAAEGIDVRSDAVATLQSLVRKQPPT